MPRDRHEPVAARSGRASGASPRAAWLGWLLLLASALPAAASAQGESGSAQRELDSPTSPEREPERASERGSGETERAERGDAAPGPGVSLGGEPRDFDEVSEFLGVETRRGPWRLDDGVGPADVPWDDYDAASSYGPRGAFHLGVGARVAAMPGGGDGLPAPDGPLIELSLLADVRYSPTKPWRLRLALAVNYQPYDEENVGGGTFIAQSPFAVRLRVMPLSFDLGRWIGILVGADVGVQWAPGAGIDAGEAAPLVATSAEVVLHLLDGALEVGLVGGLQFTAVGRAGRDGFGWDLRPEGVLGVSGGYFFE